MRIEAMPDVCTDELDEIEQLVWFEAERINFLRRSQHLDLQLAALRRWRRFECLVELYIERCATARRTPRLPFIEKPVVIQGDKNGVHSQDSGKSK